ncbi:MAG: dihydroorotase [Candidatus Omnitrophica bacterium]|nr:dihydroorotase [Candidatus Omnitrophota bacterium]
MKLLIKGGRVIDPANNLDGVLDILVENGKIFRIAKGIEDRASRVIDARDKIVMPGLIDMHVHLRQPGREDKETVASGTAAALKGGVTSCLAMPNTEPAIDCVENVELLKSIIRKSAQIDVFLAAAITKGRLGKELVDVAGLEKHGVVVITDDGASVDDDKLMFSALKKAKAENVLVICHCEDKVLSQGGVVNFGFTSTRLGLRGIPKESEYRRVARDIELARKTNARVHIAHLSCSESVELVASAKKKGLKVTAETAPHYFSLNEEAVLGFDTNMKINPPLRSKNDMIGIRQGLKEGVIDVIASDHAPHTECDKDIEFERAEFGVIGLETELSAAITELVKPGLLSWPELVNRMAYKPAKILGINKGTLSIGAQADIIVISEQKEWVVQKESLISKSKNSCFLNKKLKGIVECTIFKGKIVYKK